MTTQVFQIKTPNVGDKVIYNSLEFIITQLNPLNGKNTETNTIQLLDANNVLFPVFKVNEECGESKIGNLRHVFNYFDHVTSNTKKSWHQRKGSHYLDKSYRSTEIIKNYNRAAIDETYIAIANTKHNMLLYINDDGKPMTCDETFFEYAYRNKVFAYCDMCIQEWASANEKNEEIMKVLSFISQPPMNTMIQQPVFCMFEKERAYDRTTAYEAAYVEKIIETNKTNFEIEEPAYAEEMSEEQFNEVVEHFKNGKYDDVCIQIDSYDAYLMNTRLMTTKNVSRFLQDGAFRARNRSIKDLFPPTNHRSGCQGIHFVSTPILGAHTQVPMKLFNFKLFEEFLFQNIIFDDNMDNAHKVVMRKSFQYTPPVVDTNTLALSFTIQEFEDNSVPWKGTFYLQKEEDNEVPAKFKFELYRKEQRIYFNFFHILLFATDAEHEPMRLISTDLNDQYEHPQERIIERGSIHEISFGADGTLFITVRSNNDQLIVVSNDTTCLPAPSCVNVEERNVFRAMMQNHAREIRFPDKSYALKKINFGLYHIPRTVYAPNKLRLSNGKIPKKCKLLDSTWKTTSRNYTQTFQNHIESLKDIIPVPNTEVGLKQTPNVTLEQIVQMIREDKLLEVHEILSRVSFGERNTIIMGLRRINGLNYPFNQLFACIMNKSACLALMKSTTMQEDWENFYLKKETMPSTFDTFEIQVDTLQVSDYVKKKLHCKIGDHFHMSPLILGMLLKQPIPDAIFDYCNSVKVTDNDLYPIHFVVNFCDDAAKRKEYLIRLLKKEQPHKNAFDYDDYQRIHRKWNPNEAKHLSLLDALSEWPFDDVFQALFLLMFPMNKPDCIYKRRNWFKKDTMVIQKFASTPGHKVLEHRMKHYGYPKDDTFLASWKEGFSWLNKIGLMRTANIFTTIVEDPSNAYIVHEGDQEALDELKIYMACYELQQTDECLRMKTRVANRDQTLNFDSIFLSEFNIHHEPINGGTSFYQYMISNPRHWADSSCCFSEKSLSSKLVLHYLDSTPNLDDYFKPLQDIYIGIRLSLFAQSFSIRRYNSSVQLCRSGGTVQQLRALHSLIKLVKPVYTQFMYTDLQHILTDKVNNGLLTSAYMRTKYVASSPTHWNFPFRTDNIHTILGCPELLLFTKDKTKLRREIDRRVLLIVNYMELYMKQCTFGIISKQIDNPELYRSNNMTNRYIYFIHKLTNTLFDVADTLHKSAVCKKQKDAIPGTIFFFILTSPVWDQTYMKDVKRFHFMLTDQPTLLSHASILFYEELDLGQIWWKSWKSDLEEVDFFESEMLRIFRTDTIQLHRGNYFYNAIQFIFKYIVNEDDIFCDPCYKVSHRSPDRLANYDFLGTALMDILVRLKEIAPHFVRKVDALLHKIIVNSHHNEVMQIFVDYQPLDIFYMLAPSRFTSKMTTAKRSSLFNNICAIFLRLDLPISMVAFFHAIEKNMDYHRMDQSKPHILKDVESQYIQPNTFMRNFKLSEKNMDLLLRQYKKPDAHVYWQILVTNLHFNGGLSWVYFHKHLNNKMSDIHHMYQYHMQIVEHVKKQSTTCYFRKDLLYSVPFFVQHGLNPFLFDFMQCKEDPSKDWVMQLLQTKMKKLIGWPFNMYFSNIGLPCTYSTTKYNFATKYAYEITIDHMFTVNENMYGYDYRNLLQGKPFLDSELQNGTGAKHRLSGLYILEASSFIGYTIMTMYQQNEVLKFNTIIDFVRKVFLASNMPYKYIVSFPHAVVKSQHKQQIVHAKLNLFSLLELFCDDFTATDLEILLEKISGFSFSEEELEKRATHTEDQKLVTASFIVDQIKTNIEFSIQFSDKIDIFKTYIKWACKYIEQLGLSKQHIFTTYILPMKTNHQFIENKLYTFDVDLLTFACQYGRTQHVQFFVDMFTNDDVELWNLQRRLAIQSTDKSVQFGGIHLGYIHSTKDPIQHLLYITAINGHVESFSSLLCFVDQDRFIRLGSLMKELVKVVKFSMINCDKMANLLKRKRHILTTILTHQKFKPEYLILEPAYSYLHGQLNTILDKPTTYLTLYKPTGVPQNRSFMRTILETWGNHIADCLTLLNQYHFQPRPIHIKTAINFVLLYSNKLINYTLANYKEHAHETKTVVQYFGQINMDIQSYIEKHSDIEPRKFLYVYYILNMENKNKNTSIKEIICNGYLETLLSSILVEEDIVTILKFSVKFFEDAEIIDDFVDFVNTLRLPKRRKTEATV